jgi:hypothetical protein
LTSMYTTSPSVAWSQNHRREDGPGNSSTRTNAMSTTTTTSTSTTTNNNNTSTRTMLSDFSMTGKALTAQEKLDKAKMKGYCVRCGTKTHTGHPLRRKKRISSELVWQGVCIKCNPNKVPEHVLRLHRERSSHANRNSSLSSSLIREAR